VAPGSADTAMPVPPTEMHRKPARTRRCRSGPRYRLCNHEPTDHPTADPTNGSAAVVGANPCWTVSESGTRASMPKKAPASMPRKATAVGTPRRTVAVPGGSRTRSAHTSAANAAGVSSNHGRLGVLPGLLQHGDGNRDHEGATDARHSVRRADRISGRQVSQRRGREHSSDQHQRNEAEEHQPPRQVLGQRPRDGRPEQRGQHPGRRDRGEEARPQRCRVQLADDHIKRGDDQSAAEALHDAAEHQLPHGLGQSRDQ
jgi:hypothetical protein